MVNWVWELAAEGRGLPVAGELGNGFHPQAFLLVQMSAKIS